MAWKFYVYELIDPRDDSVFYVGKGCGDRIDQHEKETRNGVSSKKCNKIRRIINSGLAIGKRKVAYFRDEQDAYEFEDRLIREYGKDALTNVLPFRDDVPATVNPFQSDVFLHLLAIGFRSKAGYSQDYSDRPFSKALHSAFMNRFDAFVDKCIKEIGAENMQAGLRRFGVELSYGR